MTTDLNWEEQRHRAVSAGQGHLFAYWEHLEPQQKVILLEQVARIDFELLQRLWSGASETDPRDTPAAKAQRAVSPTRVVRVPVDTAGQQSAAQAREIGEQLLRDGRVGAILVAGGEGSRLGFPHPKGMFPIGPVSGYSLYQLLAEQLLARGRRAGRSIPYCIMTSDSTDEPTREFFARQHWFGMPPGDVTFFRQGTMPAVDRYTGKVLMASRWEVAQNPDGHGGMLAALAGSGCLEMLRERKVDYLFYHQVDNPLARVCDPEFLGFHHLFQAAVSTKAVAKLSPQEKMGVLVEVDGRTEIIEYSDLPAADAERRSADGQLLFWAGSTAIHVFNRTALEALSTQGSELPFHRAIKKVPCLDAAGELVEPTSENAVKYERFIFDVLPLAGPGLVVEARREEEFCPLKNKSGDFSADHVQRALHQLHSGWLRDSGVDVGTASPIEISPLRALDAADLKLRLPPGPAPSGAWHLTAEV